TMNEAYIERRNFVTKRLQEMGLSVTKPNGAFYIFPSIEQFGLASYDFANQLLHSKQVAVVPGSSFSPYGEGFIRISYANSMDQLSEAMNRLEAFYSIFNFYQIEIKGNSTLKGFTISTKYFILPYTVYKTRRNNNVTSRTF